MRKDVQNHFVGIGEHLGEGEQVLLLVGRDLLVGGDRELLNPVGHRLIIMSL